MKLSTKISTGAVGFLFLFSQIFSLWFLNNMREEIMGNIRQQEWNRLAQEAEEFDVQLSEQRQQNSLGKIYWGKESFVKSFSENTALFYEGMEIFNTTPYEFELEKIQERILGRKEKSRENTSRQEIGVKGVFPEKTKEHRLLIFLVQVRNYQIVHYKDVTSVFEQIRSIFWKGMAGAAILCGVLLAAFQLVIHHILKPLYQLKTVSDGFVQGNYRERLSGGRKDEIGEISQAFNHMADQVETHIRELAEENEKQRRLLGSLAHELKTPMTAIQGYAQTLQRLSLPPEKQEKSLAYIEKECKRLSRLSAKMLELTRLWEGVQVERKKIWVEELFAQVEETVNCRLKEKQLYLESRVKKGLWIFGDEDLLISLLVNLVDNACKASPPEGRIQMEGSREGLFVLDEGPGIPKQEWENITEPFYMLDKSRARKEGGAGLGLSLCIQIARIHEGTLVLENLPGKGFRIGFVTKWLQEGGDLDTEERVQ